MSASDAEYWNRYIPPGFTQGQDPGMALAAQFGITQAPQTPFPERAVENEENEMDDIDNMAVPTLAPTAFAARAEEAPDPAPLPRAEDMLAKAPVQQAPQAQKAAPAPGHHGDAINMDT